MGQQLFFEGLGFAIWQHIDGNALFEIDEDRPVASSPAKAKIIHAQHTRSWDLTLLLFADETQELIRTGL
jgi:hypothetical protein